MKNRFTRISRASFLILSLIFLLALLMRMQYLRLAENQILIARDAKQYVNYGRNLIHHGTFSKGDPATMPQPDAFRSPAYPVLIAFSMRVGGESHYLQWLVYTQALLSALLVPLTICIYFTLIYMVFAPWPRYGVPLRPELYLCAMWALTFFTRIIGNRWRTSGAYA